MYMKKLLLSTFLILFFNASSFANTTINESEKAYIKSHPLVLLLEDPESYMILETFQNYNHRCKPDATDDNKEICHKRVLSAIATLKKNGITVTESQLLNPVFIKYQKKAIKRSLNYMLKIIKDLELSNKFTGAALDKKHYYLKGSLLKQYPSLITEE